MSGLGGCAHCGKHHVLCSFCGRCFDCHTVPAGFDRPTCEVKMKAILEAMKEKA